MAAQEINIIGADMVKALEQNPLALEQAKIIALQRMLQEKETELEGLKQEITKLNDTQRP